MSEHDHLADVAEHAEDAAASSESVSGGEPCAEQPLPTRLEALLLTSDRPMTESRLAELLGIDGKGAAKRIREAMDELNRVYEESTRSFRAERLAGGWQLLTKQDFGPLLARLHTDRQQGRLSQAALDTLAIVAYRQPIMRAEIEAIRGVASGEVLRGLLERRLVKIVGRAEELGRPMLYGTTGEFLKVFGLASLDDLPEVKGVSAPDEPKKARRKAKPDSDAGEQAEAGAERESDDGDDDEGDEPDANKPADTNITSPDPRA